MTPAARLSAAIEVIADIDARRRPAPDALKDWGLSHRFAGSGDRAAIAGLVYDALRRRASSTHIMGEGSARASVLGMLRLERKLDPAAISALADGARFAPAPLNEQERTRLAAADLAGAAPWVAGDYPEWLDPYLARVFGEERAAEGAALASRARRSRGRAHPLVAGRPAHRAGRGRQKPGDPCRAGLHQGHDRGAGRGLAGRSADRRRQARRARGRSLGRCRRQDAGARRRHAESRSALSGRHRQTPARTDS